MGNLCVFHPRLKRRGLLLME